MINLHNYLKRKPNRKRQWSILLPVAIANEIEAEAKKFAVSKNELIEALWMAAKETETPLLPEPPQPKPETDDILEELMGVKNEK